MDKKEPLGYVPPIRMNTVTEAVQQRAMAAIRAAENEFLIDLNTRMEFEVDREELLKALNYDRNQYEKGFEDGMRAGRTARNASTADTEAVRYGQWEEMDEYPFASIYACSECGRSITVSPCESLSDYPYCHCGAKMKNPDELDVSDNDAGNIHYSPKLPTEMSAPNQGGK